MLVFLRPITQAVVLKSESRKFSWYKTDEDGLLSLNFWSWFSGGRILLPCSQIFSASLNPPAKRELILQPRRNTFIMILRSCLIVFSTYGFSRPNEGSLFTSVRAPFKSKICSV